ncbi:MAG TPA: hypothetical protein PKJ20_00090 [Bacillota bacterium]|nr:hypothetical protein [Bacillota bacterium]
MDTRPYGVAAGEARAALLDGEVVFGRGGHRHWASGEVRFSRILYDVGGDVRVARRGLWGRGDGRRALPEQGGVPAEDDANGADIDLETGDRAGGSRDTIH